jgi:hypothetical protein
MMIQVPVYIDIPEEQLIPGPQGIQGDPGADGINSSAWKYTSVPGDNKAAFQAFIADAVAAGVKSVSIGAEWIEFHSKPDIPAGMRITGENSSESALVRCYSGDFIQFSSGFNGGLHKLAIYAASGTSGGAGLLLRATASLSPDYSSFSDLVITGAGTWAWPLFIDGTQRASPQGVRDLDFRNINLFCGTLGALQIANGVGVTFTGLGAYPAGGSSGNVYIGSGSNTVNLIAANVQGELNLVNLQKLVFSGHLISLNSAGSASKCHISGTHGGGAIVNNLSNSVVDLL